MDTAIHQSIAFVLLIVIGLLLKLRIREKTELKGIKALILCVALPATIFAALLKIRLTSSLMALPILGLSANLFLFAIGTWLLIPLLTRGKTDGEKRTWMLMLPSLAPGLSCFPFLMEYLGDEALAHAALADVGNKIFVLIILYLIAMKWYYAQKATSDVKVNTADKLKDLVLSLVREPVNAVIVVALVLLSLGLNTDSLPLFMQDLIRRGNNLTTAMVLIFIGLALRINWKEAQSIMTMLLIRSGVAFLLSAVLLTFIGATLPTFLALVIVVFPQSSCSFWPFAHMSAINTLEENQSAPAVKPTFSLQLGLNILACSLPFSSLLILSICATGTFFASAPVCFGFGALMLALGIAMRFLPQRTASFARGYLQDIQSIREVNQRVREGA